MWDPVTFDLVECLLWDMNHRMKCGVYGFGHAIGHAQELAFVILHNKRSFGLCNIPVLSCHSTCDTMMSETNERCSKADGGYENEVD